MFKNFKIKFIEEFDSILKTLEEDCTNPYIKIYSIPRLNIFLTSIKEQKTLYIVK